MLKQPPQNAELVNQVHGPLKHGAATPKAWIRLTARLIFSQPGIEVAKWGQGPNIYCAFFIMPLIMTGHGLVFPKQSVYKLKARFPLLQSDVWYCQICLLPQSARERSVPITIPISVSINQHCSKELEMCVLPSHSPSSFCKVSRQSFTLWIFFSTILDLALVENSIC